jgi:hypothetical protein
MELLNLPGNSFFHSGWFTLAYNTDDIVAPLPSASSVSIFRVLCRFTDDAGADAAPPSAIPSTSA